MKTNNNNLFFLLILVFSFALYSFVLAQEKKKKDVTIEVKIRNNGETKTVVKKMDENEVRELKKVLDELGVMEEVDVSSDREDVSVSINIDGIEEKINDITLNINEITKKLEDYEKRGHLGVYIEYSKDEKYKGAKVIEVIKNSAASKAGFQNGDLITAVNDKKVDNANLTELISAYKPGEKVSIEYIRDGKSCKKEVVLGKRMVDNILELGPDFPWEDFYLNFDWKLSEDGLYSDDYKKENKAFLGISPTDEDKEDAAGVKVGKVYDNSAAQSMGLQEGDIIYEMDNEPVTTFAPIAERIAKHKPGDKINIKYTRNGEKMEGTVELKSISETLPVAPKLFLGDYMDDWFYDEINKSKNESDPSFEQKAKEEPVYNADNTLRIKSLELVPNPSKGTYKLQFTPFEKGSVTLKVTDESGREVLTKELTEANDKYEAEIDMSNEPKGNYLLHISRNNKTFKMKMIK